MKRKPIKRKPRDLHMKEMIAHPPKAGAFPDLKKKSNKNWCRIVHDEDEDETDLQHCDCHLNNEEK